MCLVFRLMSITNVQVQTELHEHIYGNKSSVWASVAGGIFYMPIDKHKHNNLLNPIMGCLYVNLVGLHVSVIHMTIIRSVRAKEVVMQQSFPERNF